MKTSILQTPELGVTNDTTGDDGAEGLRPCAAPGVSASQGKLLGVARVVQGPARNHGSSAGFAGSNPAPSTERQRGSTVTVRRESKETKRGIRAAVIARVSTTEETVVTAGRDRRFAIVAAQAVTRVRLGKLDKGRAALVVTTVTQSPMARQSAGAVPAGGSPQEPSRPMRAQGSSCPLGHVVPSGARFGTLFLEGVR